MDLECAKQAVSSRLSYSYLFNSDILFLVAGKNHSSRILKSETEAFVQATMLLALSSRTLLIPFLALQLLTIWPQLYCRSPSSLGCDGRHD
jgi:hypothetical protein